MVSTFSDSVSSILSHHWLDKIEGYTDSEHFGELLSFLKKEKKEGKIIYPKTEDVFKVFNLCKPEDVKVVICLQDPFFSEGVADGIALSCSYSTYPQPSLRHFQNEIRRTVKGYLTPQPLDLSYLVTQGVLLVNRALTVVHKSPGSHVGKWDKFMDEVFKVLGSLDQPIVYVLLGNDAMYFSRYIKEKDILIKARHPASAAYTGGSWNCVDLFQRINEYLESNNLSKINW